MFEGRVVVIDMKGHLLGRAASMIAKELLCGQQIVRRRRANSPSVFCWGGCCRWRVGVLGAGQIRLVSLGGAVDSASFLVAFPRWRSGARTSTFRARSSGTSVRQPVTCSKQTHASHIKHGRRLTPGPLACAKTTVKFGAFLRKRMNTNPKKGPIHYRSPAKILWCVPQLPYDLLLLFGLLGWCCMSGIGGCGGGWVRGGVNQ